MKKIIYVFLVALLVLPAAAEEFADVESYDAEASVFQKIADLEQEKVLMQLEKEKAQLQLDLDRLAAEQSRLARDQEGADMRAAEQSAEIERQKMAIEEERGRLDEQKRKMAEEAAKRAAENDAGGGIGADILQARDVAVASAPDESDQPKSIADVYFLREIIGAGNQLIATVENLGSGKQKKISVGKTLDGYAVRAISLDDGVELEKDGEITVLNVGQPGAAAAE